MATIMIKDSKGRKHYIPDMWDKKRPRVSFSNGKTGIPSINTLAGNANHIYNGAIPGVLKEYFPLICGTCCCDCPGCYAKMISRNIEPFVKMALNTLEARQDPEQFFWFVEKELYGNPIVTYKVARLHDSGDFFNREYLDAGVDFINRHKETRFGAYTKAEDLIKEFGIDNLPDNMSCSCSPWEGICEPIGDLPQFIYDDGSNPALASLPHCPAVNKEGKRTGVQCKDCLHCYKAQRGDVRCVYAH